MDAMEMRRNAIAELVNKHGTVSFSQIKEQFPNVSEMTLRTLIVNGYAREVLAKLPMEFAVEAQKLLSISLEGSVG